jgi:hypothetical protein
VLGGIFYRPTPADTRAVTGPARRPTSRHDDGRRRVVVGWMPQPPRPADSISASSSNKH